MFDRLRIRSKLIVLLAAPLLALLVLAGTVGLARNADANETSNDGKLFEAARLASTAAHEMQVETELAVLYAATSDAADADANKKDWEAQAKNSDKAIAAMRQELTTIDSQELDDVTRSSLSLIERTSDSPRTARSIVGGGVTDWPAALEVYENISGAFVEAASRLANSTANPELNEKARSWSLAVQIEADVARQRSRLTGVFTDNFFTAPAEEGATETAGNDTSYENFIETVTDEQSHTRTLDDFGEPEVVDQMRDALSGNEVSAADDLREKAIDGQDSTDLEPEVTLWRVASGKKLDRVRKAEVDVANGVLDQADQLTSDAKQGARLFIAGALLVVFLAVLLAFFVGRRIARPLVNLTHAADRLAREQLPRLVESLRNPAEDDVSHLASSLTPITITGNDEIGQLAQSFNTVQTVAVDVATEQAALLRKGIGEMFVNLARRNQTLLDRQIEFLDKLEADEENPDQLDNLFKLDHMATRMRRNAESLLVLAGAEPTRRRGRPVPLADVVRAALAEVEDFNRIDLMSFDDVLLQSNAASDMAHLLSELMENATNFSPPDTRVEVVGHSTKSEGYVVSVTDHGIGMSAEQIADANELLATPPLVGLTLSRSLGFIVIGRLAGRFGVTVRLMSSSSGGVTAVVLLPPGLVTDPAAAVLLDEAPGEEAMPVQPEAPTSEFLPPLEYTPYDHEETGPSRLDDAVPVGAAFDEGLAAMVDQERTAYEAEAADEAQYQAVAEPVIEPVVEMAPPPEPPARPRKPVKPLERPMGATAGPEPLPVLPGEPPSAPVAGVGLFGLPPEAPAPAKPPVEAPLPANGNGAGTAPGAMPKRPSRKRTTGVGPTGPKPADRRQSTGPKPSTRATPAPAPAPAPVAPIKLFGADAPTAEVQAVAPPPPVQTGPAGLPRRTAGGTRPKPGGEGRQVGAPAGVAKAKRSPDEVRNMLSAYRGGVQRGQNAEQSSKPNDAKDQK